MTTSQRHGHTLIEMVVVIAITSAILGALTAVLVSSLRTSQAATNQWSHSRAVIELSRQLRADAHQASVARVEDHALVLELTAGQIRYAQVGAHLERRQQGEVSAREVYRLDEGNDVAWTLAGDAPMFITCQLTPTTDSATTTPDYVGTRIEVEVGRDRRVAAALRSQEPAP